MCLQIVDDKGVNILVYYVKMTQNVIKKLDDTKCRFIYPPTQYDTKCNLNVPQILNYTKRIASNNLSDF